MSLFYFYFTLTKVSVKFYHEPSKPGSWLLHSPAVAHRAVMAHVMGMAAEVHRTVRAPHAHPPAAEAAVRMDPRAIVSVIRAREQPSDEGHYNDKDDQTEHCYSPFAVFSALLSP